jgi:methylmalonyl-CoA/ethylmalonyl-CoA epimerase
MIQVKAINHIGIAVKSIAEHRDFYEKTLGAKFEGIEEVTDQKVKVGFFLVGAPGSEVRLELLEPTSPDSPISGFLEKKGEGLHHVAYTVSDIQGRIDALKAGGVRMIDEKPRGGAHHTKIAFLHPKASCGVLTELCEPAK